MKIITLPTIILATILSAQAQAGRVITYTATSSISQEEANNSAVAGVAKQISTQVSTTQVLKKESITVDSKETLVETYKAQNNLTSDLKLNGVKITPGKKDGNVFSATATLDLDDFTADIQFKMNTEKQELSKAKKNIQESIATRHYADAARTLDLAKPRVATYEKLLQQLAQVYPINETHRLKSRLPELEKSLIQELSRISFAEQKNTSTETPSWQILVSDSQGPLPEFPVVVHKGRETLTTSKTDMEGYVQVQLKKANLEEEPFVFYIEPDLPLAILRQARLQRKLEVQYSVTRKECLIQMKCSENEDICNSIKESLSKKSIMAIGERSDAAPLINFGISAEQKNSLNSGNTALVSYDVTISMRGNNIATSTNVRSVGKSRDEAIVKAIQKADFTKLKKMLESHCK